MRYDDYTMSATKNMAESFRDVVQDLLVPELKSVKVAIDSLRTEMQLAFAGRTLTQPPGSWLSAYYICVPKVRFYMADLAQRVTALKQRVVELRDFL